MAKSFFADPANAWGTFIIFIICVAIFLIIYFLSRNDNEVEKKIKKRHSIKTQYSDLSKKVSQLGNKIKDGKLIKGTNKIGKINKWYRVTGQFDTFTYDENTKNYIIDQKAEKVDFDLHVFKCLNPNFILALLRLRCIFFILDSKSIEKFDPISNSFVINEYQRLEPHGNIWTNSDLADEYRTESSIKAQNIEMLTAIEVYPLRITAGDPNQIKKERLYREMMETDKARYDAIKKAEDTAIS